MTRTDLSEHYPRLVEHLLAARVVCANATPRLHQLLDTEQNGHDAPTAEREAIESLLETLGRRLVEDQGVFYAVMSRIDTAHAQAVIEATFDRYTRQARFIGEMFEIAREAQQAPEALGPGDRIRFAGLLEAITTTTALQDRIYAIIGDVSNAKKDLTADKALRIAFDELIDQGYLVNPSGDSQLYVVTGEIQLFAAYRDFIAEIEDLLPDEADEAIEQDSQNDLAL